jgi:hypothetical protein
MKRLLPLIFAFALAPTYAGDPVAAARKKDHDNDIEEFCKSAGNLARIVVTQVRDGDPEKEKYWMERMKDGSPSAGIVAYAFMRRSFMGPLEAEASTIKSCRQGKLPGLEDMKK